MSAQPGSTGNVIAAIASAFLPGLGQLAQGRVGAAVFFVVIGALVWLLTFGMLGWIVNVWACLDAATYRGY